MDENTEKTAVVETDAENGTADAAERKRGKKSRGGEKKKSRFGSLKMRTSITFIAFAVCILVILWGIFLIFIFGVYGGMLEDDLKAVGDVAASRISGADGIEAMQSGLSDHARNEAVSITVFTVSGEDDEMHYDTPIINIDTFGNSISPENPESFEAIMTDIDLDAFTKRGGIESVRTDGGAYLCYVAKKSVTLNGEKTELYVLVTETDDTLGTQTQILIYALVVCTSIVLIGAVVGSVFISGYQTRLIRGFSDRAKRLADGDFEGEFSGGGYKEYDNLASALNAAKDNIKKGEELQRDVIANVSHDIRTPLTMIRAYAEMLRDMPVDAQKREKTAGVIIAEADRLDTLTGDMLNLSKLQAGVAEFSFERIDVAEIARATLEEFDIFRTRDGVVFETEIEDSAMAVCDRNRMFQVFYNLIINAINYSGESKTVTVRVKPKGDAVRVEVADRGKGIDAAELDDVWDRYYRAAHTKRNTVGSGLGLSICKQILEAHSAEYGVDSEVGKGTTFWFELADKGEE